MTGCPVKPLRVSPLFERTHELSPWPRDPPPTSKQKERKSFNTIFYTLLIAFYTPENFIK